MAANRTDVRETRISGVSVMSENPTWQPKRAVVMGATGGLGTAFVQHLSISADIQQVYCLSRSGISPTEPNTTALVADYERPGTLEAASGTIAAEGPLDLVIVATGLLHANDEFGPEKSLRDLYY